MVNNKNQTNNSNKEQKSKHTDSSSSIINKKMGKERNFIVNRTSSDILEQGTDFSAIEYTYSRRTPKPDITNEILKRLEKIDSKLDNVDTRLIKLENKVDNIEQVQKTQGEKIANIELLQKAQGEEIRKINNVIFLNNLKTE
ncbi:MAG: hemolysin XhlA family protein [Mycoplasmataceae bacterium]|jgi:tetrahydromethanopterin S-methyltransferase subunit G|nr:hemolysin XhlA family protein [Mycoplasmataceae bacterium]